MGVVHAMPLALEGCTVLDLGCGTGRDVYLASQLVGQSGRVIGVDMTPQQLEVARRYQDEHRLRFGHETSNVEFSIRGQVWGRSGRRGGRVSIRRRGDLQLRCEPCTGQETSLQRSIAESQTGGRILFC